MRFVQQIVAVAHNRGGGCHFAVKRQAVLDHGPRRTIAHDRGCDSGVCMAYLHCGRCVVQIKIEAPFLHISTARAAWHARAPCRR